MIHLQTQNSSSGFFADFQLAIIKSLRRRREPKAVKEVVTSGIPLTRTRSQATSIHESLYSNRVSFIKRAARKVGFGVKAPPKPEELQRFSNGNTYWQAQREILASRVSYAE